MGTGNKAAKAAGQADAARQASINDSVQQIQRAYSSPQRQQQYTDYGKNLQDFYTGQVNDQQGVNSRNLKFALARSGLTGGSAANDANVQLNKEYSKGLIQASQQAQGGKAALEQSDVNAKNQMVSLAQQGGYTGAIPQQVAYAQKAALDSAGSYASANTLGNVFAGTAQVYNNQQVADANRRAQRSPIGSLYGSPGF